MGCFSWWRGWRLTNSFIQRLMGLGYVRHELLIDLNECPFLLCDKCSGRPYSWLTLQVPLPCEEQVRLERILLDFNLQRSIYPILSWPSYHQNWEQLCKNRVVVSSRWLCAYTVVRDPDKTKEWRIPNRGLLLQRSVNSSTLKSLLLRSTFHSSAKGTLLAWV